MYFGKNNIVKFTEIENQRIFESNLAYNGGAIYFEEFCESNFSGNFLFSNCDA